MRSLGMYIHIPFCKSKCYYCDFCSWAGKEEKIAKYIKWLKQELTDVAEGIKLDNKGEVEIATVYIGGGTPSYIDSKYITQILNLVKKEYHLANNAEITIEVNPGTATKEKLREYKEAGVNRLSIGMQSSHDKILSKIGRIHNIQEFLDTYKAAKDVGFSNINIDMMIGLPR